MNFDHELTCLIAGVVGVLIIASLITRILLKKARSEGARMTLENVAARTRAWWGMVIIFTLAILMGITGTVILFGLLSFMALREFITLTPTRPGDHRTLFWVFFVITPLHYWYVLDEWYGMYSIFIPVYAFMFVPMRSALAGDCEHFLERSAKIQWGLLICVYSVSHAPALLSLQIPGYIGENAKLLFWFVIIVEISDVLQYVWGKTCGKHKVAPKVSPNKTWEGLIGGGLSTVVIGASLWWVTPFTLMQAAAMTAMVVLLGFLGGLIMSAIKRDRGVKDWGHAIAGHGGVMDRLDSLSFAAPIFFHVTRYALIPPSVIVLP
ncbi:phosphatidate cytidylyltransferase [Prosthecobacter fusiformis]|uniref:Phosphatidate cytidylyltransferase n=1 Tax=Prosthecobacter fusiformis TaxID=48464 RepID=A0A4R7S6K2_9BACT|nr:phosphatidate cytidylyltransferase [Prosthecobacter fusiformis]TDU73316.1 phosphatidate cytidylyltransferase [Prosthecobacter fusiformis]